GKIARGRKPQQLADLGQGVAGVAQQVFALLDAAAAQVGDGGDAVFFLEGVGQVIFVQVGHAGQLVQGDALPVVGVDVALDLGALPVLGSDGGLLQLEGEGAGAHQP